MDVQYVSLKHINLYIPLLEIFVWSVSPFTVDSPHYQFDPDCSSPQSDDQFDPKYLPVRQHMQTSSPAHADQFAPNICKQKTFKKMFLIFF